jgi:hypothetical protein
MERGVFSDKSDGLEKAFGPDLTLDEGINASIAATVIFTMIEKAMGKTPTVMDRKRREAWMRRHNLTRKHCR